MTSFATYIINLNGEILGLSKAGSNQVFIVEGSPRQSFYINRQNQQVRVSILENIITDNLLCRQQNIGDTFNDNHNGIIYEIKYIIEEFKLRDIAATVASETLISSTVDEAKGIAWVIINRARVKHVDDWPDNFF